MLDVLWTDGCAVDGGVLQGGFLQTIVLQLVCCLPPLLIKLHAFIPRLVAKVG